ncbi:hypothetical protein JCM3775_003752 [Rhodotorula graminis]
MPLSLSCAPPHLACTRCRSESFPSPTELCIFYYLSLIMADRLPDEIILAILDELAASRVRGNGVTPFEDKDVRRALVMVCLTSRRLRKIAQPVLWQRATISDGVQLECLVRIGATAPLGQYTRYYTVESGACRSTLDCRMAIGAADVLPNIVELRVVGRNMPLLDPRLLLSHEHMLLVALDKVHVPPGPLACLPQLEQLSLTSIRTTSEVLSAWICPENMPSLLVLHIESVIYVDGDLPLLQDVLADGMLAQLDVSLLEHRVASPDVAAVLQGLGAQLASMGARIIWYDDDYPHDFVPPEFIRYARELKAARRSSEEEQEEGGRA